jgi:peptide methionine sulfoxide reductase msrA/msrB
MRVASFVAVAIGATFVLANRPMAYPKPPEQALRAKLTNLQFEVTQRSATEPPFHNAYWNHHEVGLYVDIVTGEPLFASRDKYDSGTGWPSFSQPVEAHRIRTEVDRTLGRERTEVRALAGGTHLGHVFEDGPKPSGLRYCINSAALRFVPLHQLAAEGYGAYRDRVQGGTVVADTINACTVGPDPGCSATLEVAVLAGGCFWGMEEILRAVPGVIDTEVGYSGGHVSNPTYEDVKTGRSGHAEAIQVHFDPQKITYGDLLEKWFFRMHDPTTRHRQGNDIGSQYRSAIFVANEDQRRDAQAVLRRAQAGWKAPIVTTIEPLDTFTPAETFHQDYLQEHPGGYSCHFLRP